MLTPTLSPGLIDRVNERFHIEELSKPEGDIPVGFQILDLNNETIIGHGIETAELAEAFAAGALLHEDRYFFGQSVSVTTTFDHFEAKWVNETPHEDDDTELRQSEFRITLQTMDGQPSIDAQISKDATHNLLVPILTGGSKSLSTLYKTADGDDLVVMVERIHNLNNGAIRFTFMSPGNSKITKAISMSDAEKMTHIIIAGQTLA